MKKRLLITSIVMMLVVAVALSTATYAWFTSNQTVTASSITLKASTSDAEALGIGWLDGVAGTSIEINANDVLKPMAPDSLTISTTTSDVIFRNATVKQENSQIVFNDDVKESYVQVTNADAKAENGETYYTKEGGLYVPMTNVEVGTTSVYGKYTKNFAPVVFNNGAGVQAFFVRNLSKANEIARVTVSASFTASNTYILTNDATFQEGTTYYTHTPAQNETPESYDEATVTAGESVTPSTYYEKISGNDLIRVAIFTKSQSQGTSSADNYTLLGVLGQTATAFAPVESGTFDKNVTYYTRSGEQGSYVYSQDTTIDGTSFTTNGTLFTATNTAVYGGSGLYDEGDAVKNLDQYIAVSQSLTLVNNLEADHQVDIVAVAWLDGTMLDDTKASVVGQVSLQFSTNAN